MFLAFFTSQIVCVCDIIRVSKLYTKFYVHVVSELHLNKDWTTKVVAVSIKVLRWLTARPSGSGRPSEPSLVNTYSNVGLIDTLMVGNARSKNYCLHAKKSPKLAKATVSFAQKLRCCHSVLTLWKHPYIHVILWQVFCILTEPVLYTMYS